MALDDWRRRFEPVIRRFLHVYWRFARPLTIGVRALVIDGDDRVFLVKHTYVHGWHLPGGGVEPGETLLAALARELREEGNIELEGTPVLQGIFFNQRVSRRDHVALYLVREFRRGPALRPNSEIVDGRFFAFGELPDDTSRATRARIAEFRSALAAPEYW